MVGDIPDVVLRGDAAILIQLAFPERRVLRVDRRDRAHTRDDVEVRDHFLRPARFRPEEESRLVELRTLFRRFRLKRTDRISDRARVIQSDHFRSEEVVGARIRRDFRSKRISRNGASVKEVITLREVAVEREIGLKDDLAGGVDVGVGADVRDDLAADVVADRNDHRVGGRGCPADQLVDAADLRFEEDLVRVIQLRSSIDASEYAARPRSSRPRDLREGTGAFQKEGRCVAVGEMYGGGGVARRVDESVDLLIETGGAVALSADGRQDVVSETVDQHSRADIGADSHEKLGCSQGPPDDVVAVLVAGQVARSRRLPCDRSVGDGIAEVGREGRFTPAARATNRRGIGDSVG